MSYDLHLFFASSDVDLETQAAEAMEQDESREGRGARRRDPELIRKRLAIARALVELNPSFEVFPPLEELEPYLSTDDSPKKAAPQATELTAPDGGNGLQITLFNGSGAINLPYCHEGEKANEALTEIQTYLSLLRERFFMYAYDQQIGKVVEPWLDKVAQQEIYEPHVQRVKRLGSERE